MAVYDDIMSSLNELLDHAEGRPTHVVVHHLRVADLQDYTPQEIKTIRLESKMTQKTFAACIGVSAKSVEAWEGGRSRPDGAARRMIGLMKNDTDFARRTGLLIAE